MRLFTVFFSFCLLLGATAAGAQQIDLPPLKPEVLAAIEQVAENKDYILAEWLEKEPEYLSDFRMDIALCRAVETQTEAVIALWAEAEVDPILFCYSMVNHTDRADTNAWAKRTIPILEASEVSGPELERYREKFIIAVKDVEANTR